MTDHCDDTIKAVMCNMRVPEDQAIAMLDEADTRRKIDQLTGYDYEPDECQEHRDRLAVEESQ